MLRKQTFTCGKRLGAREQADGLATSGPARKVPHVRRQERSGTVHGLSLRAREMMASRGLRKLAFGRGRAKGGFARFVRTQADPGVLATHAPPPAVAQSISRRRDGCVLIVQRAGRGMPSRPVAGRESAGDTTYTRVPRPEQAQQRGRLVDREGPLGRPNVLAPGGATGWLWDPRGTLDCRMRSGKC